MPTMRSPAVTITLRPRCLRDTGAPYYILDRGHDETAALCDFTTAWHRPVVRNLHRARPSAVSCLDQLELQLVKHAHCRTGTGKPLCFSPSDGSGQLPLR